VTFLPDRVDNDDDVASIVFDRKLVDELLLDSFEVTDVEADFAIAAFRTGSFDNLTTGFFSSTTFFFSACSDIFRFFPAARVTVVFCAISSRANFRVILPSLIGVDGGSLLAVFGVETGVLLDGFGVVASIARLRVEIGV
jgi:hypothetical protein